MECFSAACLVTYYKTVAQHLQGSGLGRRGSNLAMAHRFNFFLPIIVVLVPLSPSNSAHWYDRHLITLLSMDSSWHRHFLRMVRPMSTAENATRVDHNTSTIVPSALGMGLDATLEVSCFWSMHIHTYIYVFLRLYHSKFCSSIKKFWPRVGRKKRSSSARLVVSKSRGSAFTLCMLLLKDP